MLTYLSWRRVLSCIFAYGLWYSIPVIYKDWEGKTAHLTLP